jgi:hypothetical protein
MAIKGLSRPVVGKYSNVGGTVKYTEPTIANKAVSYQIAWTVGDNNPLYADNQIAENDKGTFQSGELTLSTAELPQELSMLLLGTKTITDTIKEASITVQTFDDNQSAPYLGFGIIETHQEEDVTNYRAVFLPKVFFDIPENAANTKGQTIEWQTPTITGTIQRSDQVDSNTSHPWMMDAWFEDEASALNWLEYKCGKEQS